MKVKFEEVIEALDSTGPEMEFYYSTKEEYDIKKPETSRQYEAMDELPPGRQA